MAEISRPTYTVNDPKTGKPTRKQSRTWHIRYYTPDGERHRVKGYRDRRATETKAAELERRGIREAAGVVEPSDVHAAKPLAEHLADYVRYLAAKGNTGKHVALTETRVKACLDGCRFVKIADVQPSGVLSFLDDLRQGKGNGIATANHYLTAAKGFTRWLWKDRRIGSDPLAGMSKLANVETDVRHARRELSAEECAFFLATVRASKRSFRYLTGSDRFALYLTAAGTGLRASELASLAPGSFDLGAMPPVVRAEAAYTKNRKEAELPLTAELAKVLRDYFVGRPADQPVWPGTWSNAASAKMIRFDLAEARKAWLAAFQDAGQREAAEQFDFLAYRDAAGLVADFHSLRHLYISRIVRSGATPKVAQELARHCDVRLTLGRYSHTALHDLTAAVDAMPDFLSPAAELQTFAATGTDGKGGETGPKKLSPNLGPYPAILGDFERQAETEIVNMAGSEKPRKLLEKRDISGVLLTEAPPGFEPGMADLQSARQFSHLVETPKGYDNSLGVFAPGLRETPIDPDLALLIEGWPKLPAPLRNGILAIAAWAGKDG
jgi:integrase